MMKQEDKRNLLRYRVQRAEETMKEAEDNAALGHWNLAANRLYYALFYMSLALLLDKGVSVKSHAGVIAKVGQELVLPGLLDRDDARIISKLQNMRHSGDYDDYNYWTGSDVLPMFKPTKELLGKMRSLLTLV